MNIVATLGKLLILKRCPHCGVDSPNLEEVHRFYTQAFNNTNNRLWAVYSCKRCGGVVTAFVYSATPNAPIVEMFPKPIIVDESIPDIAKAYLDQALDSIHVPSGAIMLCASSIDAMLKNKGFAEGSLYTRINQAVEAHLITKEMADWAHEVRFDANEQRHADVNARLPNESDAKKSVDFALALAQFLFVMPSRVQHGIEEAKIK